MKTLSEVKQKLIEDLELEKKRLMEESLRMIEELVLSLHVESQYQIKDSESSL